MSNSRIRTPIVRPELSQVVTRFLLQTGVERIEFARESEVWIADCSEHMLHSNGDWFLEPYLQRIRASDIEEGV